MMWVWGYLATIQASLLVGFACLIYLFPGMLRERKWQRENGLAPVALREKATGIVALGASFYTYIILVIGDYFLGIPISESIEVGFGDDRIAFLLVLIIAEQTTKIVDLFKK